MKAVKLREGNYLGNLGLCLISERKPRFCVFGHLCHSFLVQILPTWLSGLKVWQKPEPTISDDLDPALQSQQHWAAISGKRARKTEAFVKSLAVDMGTKLTILFIVDEPLRFLTFQFMKFSDVANTNPTLVQFANKGRSPLLAATQYLSSLLLENPQMGPGRLILIWKSQAFDLYQNGRRQDLQTYAPCAGLFFSVAPGFKDGTQIIWSSSLSASVCSQTTKLLNLTRKLLLANGIQHLNAVFVLDLRVS